MTRHHAAALPLTCCCPCTHVLQRTWAYLESLFISSEEVKKELPEATQRFVKIDADVKSILRAFKQTQNCIECCSKEGLLKNLEKQQSELEVRNTPRRTVACKQFHHTSAQPASLVVMYAIASTWCVFSPFPAGL